MKIRSKLLTILLTFTTFGQVAYSAEADYWTKRSQKLPNSIYQINKYGNELFDQVLKQVNSGRATCDEKRLYNELKWQFWNEVHGEFTNYIIRTPEIKRRKLLTEDSVYKYNFFISLFENAYDDTLANVFNVNGHLVSSDKFEHFHETGYRYFVKHYIEKKSLNETFKIGTKDEEGIMGAWTTGTISYADMVADFHGMRFWNHILQKHNDIFNENLGPYVTCQNRKWVKVKNIDWGKYVDDGWDEAINCSKFRFKRHYDNFLKGISDLEADTNTEITCPMNMSKMDNLKTKYGSDISKIMLNANGWELTVKD